MSVHFYERFRAELANYAEGVHVVGGPAPADALAELPAQIADFYRSYNGAQLFVGATVLWPASALERHEGRLVFGAMGDDDILSLDLSSGDEPRVLRTEADTEDTLIEGTSFAVWIEGLIVADATIYDREGDFRENLFDDSGENLRPEIVVKREKRALKIDPDAPAPAWRQGRALERLGRDDEALTIMTRVTTLAPGFSWAHYDCGRLNVAAQILELAEQNFLAAADCEASPDTAAFFLAHAARTASVNGNEDSRAAHAKKALALSPAITSAQKGACQSHLEDDETDRAREALSLAKALSPHDLEVIDLARKLT